MNVSPVGDFWNRVKEEMAIIEVDISKQTLQPRDGSVYIVSLRDRGPNGRDAKAGVLSEVSKKLASQKLVEGKHQLATDVEINEHLVSMKERQRIARSSVAGASGIITLAGPKED